MDAARWSYVRRASGSKRSMAGPYQGSLLTTGTLRSPTAAQRFLLEESPSSIKSTSEALLEAGVCARYSKRQGGALRSQRAADL